MHLTVFTPFPPPEKNLFSCGNKPSVNSSVLNGYIHFDLLPCKKQFWFILLCYVTSKYHICTVTHGLFKLPVVYLPFFFWMQVDNDGLQKVHKHIFVNNFFPHIFVLYNFEKLPHMLWPLYCTIYMKTHVQLDWVFLKINLTSVFSVSTWFFTPILDSKLWYGTFFSQFSFLSKQK